MVTLTEHRTYDWSIHTAAFMIDDNAETFTFAELMRENDHDQTLRDLLHALRPNGGYVTYGGGAAASFTIKRVR